MTEVHLIKDASQAYKIWDKKSVIIRQQSVASTIVYPRLPPGARYRGYSLRDDYVLASLRTLEEAVRWCRHQYYDYSILGQAPPELR